MNKDKHIKEYLKKWQNVKLSDSSRARIKENLLAHARFHGATEESVRAPGENRLRVQVRTRTSFFTRFNFTSMQAIVLAVVLIIGGGTSFAAEGSLPGDLLYPVKVGFNENIKSGLAFSSESEAELQAELLEERIREAEELKAEGRLEGELALEVRGNIESQVKEAEEASDETDASTAVETRSSVRLALAKFNTLVGGGSLAIKGDGVISVQSGNGIAMDTSTSDSEETSTMSMSYGTSMMIAKEVVVAELRPQTKDRIKGLATVIERHKAEFKADVYAELNAQINEANKLLVRSETEAEAEAKTTVITAADIAGQIESTLSTLGQVKIDEETGAIIDIDLSQKPEPISIEPMPLPMPVPDPAFGGGVDGNTGMEVDISDDMIEGTIDGSLETTSEISI